MDKILSPIKGRIIQFIENENIAKEKFFRDTNISASNFKGKGAASELGGEKIVSILTTYPNLNPDWLILAKGQMIRNQNPQLLEENNAPYTLNKVSRLKTDRNKEIQEIPLYDLQATAGIVDLLSDTSRQKHVPIDYIVIPNLPKCDGALPITGDSMYPLLKSGDMVLYKEMNDKRNIIWGEMYLVAIKHGADDFFFCKYIHKSEREGYIRLVSQNQHHQPVEFPLDSVKALALIKASIRINTAF